MVVDVDVCVAGSTVCLGGVAGRVDLVADVLGGEEAAVGGGPGDASCDLGYIGFAGERGGGGEGVASRDEVMLIFGGGGGDADASGGKEKRNKLWELHVCGLVLLL